MGPASAQWIATLGLQPSDGSDCHFPMPSEAGGKLRRGTRRRKQNWIWEKREEWRPWRRDSAGRWGPLQSQGPPVSPCFPARIHYEQPGKETTPSEGECCHQAQGCFLNNEMLVNINLIFKDPEKGSQQSSLNEFHCLIPLTSKEVLPSSDPFAIVVCK